MKPRRSAKVLLGGRVRVETVNDPRWDNVVPIGDAGRRARRGT